MFQRLDGVLSVVSGYAGGQIPNPTYEAICHGITGHAEVVQIALDPATRRPGGAGSVEGLR